jgi:hypothetical protein
MRRGETEAGPRIEKTIRKMMDAEIGTGEILIKDLSQEKSAVQEKILASVTKRPMKKNVTGMTSTVLKMKIRAALMTAKLRVRMNRLPRKIRSLGKINFKIQIRSPKNNSEMSSMRSKPNHPSKFPRLKISKEDPLPPLDLKETKTPAMTNSPPNETRSSLPSVTTADKTIGIMVIAMDLQDLAPTITASR